VFESKNNGVANHAADRDRSLWGVKPLAE